VQDIRAACDDRGIVGKPVVSVEAEIDAAAGAVLVTVNCSLRTRTVHLTAAVLQRARSDRVGPLQLIAAALACRDELEEAGLPAGEPAADSDEAIRDLLARHVNTSADEQIIRSLAQLHDVLLIGQHGTGKSATVAARADSFRSNGGGLIWLDLAQASTGPQTVYEGLLRAERYKEYLIVLDATQANIPVLQQVCAAADQLRDLYGVPLAVLATGLPALVRRLPDVFVGFRPVMAKPNEIMNAMLAETRLTRPQRESIRNLAGTDLVIARMAITFHEEHGRVPTQHELEETHVGQVTDERQQQALYWFACLGYFQVDVTSAAAATAFSADVLSWLLERGLIVRSNGQYSAGPRSRAELALRFALRQWDAKRRWRHPSELAWQYLRVAGEPAIRAVLDRLDRTGAAAGGDNPTRYLLPAWDYVRRLERHLAKLCLDDPTWLDNEGAAIFAGLAMARMRHAEAWRAVADFVRTRWTYDAPNALPSPAGPPTADQLAFPKIREAMRGEDKDKLFTFPAAGPRETADDVDIDRFHRGWMLGLLLCFEGAALIEDGDRIRRLQAIAAEVQDPDGFFYPRRVPWVTARVVLGLCATGLSYETSDVVRQACDWLLTPVEEGGAFDASWWRSGTGSWNRQEATTAMCLAALLHAEAPLTARQTMAAAWLWTDQAQDQWGRPGREIDLALVVEATSLDGERWRDAYPLVRELLQWAVEALRSPPPMTDVNEGDLRLPFVTYELMTFVWRLVNREFSVLLAEMLELPTDSAGLTLMTDGEVESGLQAISQIIGTIEAHLNRLNDRLRSSDLRDEAVHAEVGELQRALNDAEGLRIRLRAPASRDLLDEIDVMGHKHCGVAWRPPWPKP
jgi:hypothetical protein